MSFVPPLQAVRDLLGVVRTLYRKQPSEALEQAGKSLASASDLLGSPPGSLGYKAALQHVNDACDLLEALPPAHATACVVTAVRAVRPVEMN